MLSSGYESIRAAGASLNNAVKHFSNNKDGSPAEITDGLRVLGCPIGSSDFCQRFITKVMIKAIDDSNILLTELDDYQTILQLYRRCTQHKLTHLFSSDVLNEDFDNLPDDMHLWDSNSTSVITSSLGVNTIH